MFALVKKWQWLRCQSAYRNSAVRVMLRLLVWRMHCQVGRPAVVALPTFGVRLWLPPQWRGVAKLIYAFREDYEPELQYFWSKLRVGDAVVDVGASFGLYSLVAASRVGPAGRVLAFEPARASYDVLCRNVALNGYRWLRAFRLALANRTGTATLYHHPDPSRNSLGPTGTRAHEQVALVTLDDVLDTGDIPGRLAAMKIDVEGAEALVLQGAQRTIAQFRPLIIFEVNPDAARQLGSEPDAAWSLLETWNYRFFTLAEGGTLQPLAAPPPGGNVIALPNPEGVA